MPQKCCALIPYRILYINDVKCLSSICFVLFLMSSSVDLIPIKRYKVRLPNRNVCVNSAQRAYSLQHCVAVIHCRYRRNRNEKKKNTAMTFTILELYAINSKLKRVLLSVSATRLHLQ